MQRLIICNSITTICFFVFFSLSCKNLSESDTKNENYRSLSGTITANDKRLSVLIHEILQEQTSILPDTLLSSEKHFLHQIDSASKAILSKKEFINNPIGIIDEIRNCVFNVWQIKFRPEHNKLQSVFPHQAFNIKQGSCLSISLIFLIFGEKLNLPLYGVLAPGHFFIRYDDCKIRMNIETLRNGESMSDSWYKSRYRITDTTLYNLENLSTPAVLASIRFNLGNFYLANNWPDLSLNQFNRAIQLNPAYVEAQGNRAIALDASGNSDAALKILLQLKKKHPDLNSLHKNLGALYLKRKNYQNAIEEYRAALTCTPLDTESLYGLGISYLYSNHRDNAVKIFRNLLQICPDHHEANQFFSDCGRNR